MSEKQKKFSRREFLQKGAVTAAGFLSGQLDLSMLSQEVPINPEKQLTYPDIYFVTILNDQFEVVQYNLQTQEVESMPMNPALEQWMIEIGIQQVEYPLQMSGDMPFQELGTGRGWMINLKEPDAEPLLLAENIYGMRMSADGESTVAFPRDVQNGFAQFFRKEAGAWREVHQIELPPVLYYDYAQFSASGKYFGYIDTQFRYVMVDVHHPDQPIIFENFPDLRAIMQIVPSDIEIDGHYCYIVSGDGKVYLLKDNGLLKEQNIVTSEIRTMGQISVDEYMFSSMTKEYWQVLVNGWEVPDLSFDYRLTQFMMHPELGVIVVSESDGQPQVTVLKDHVPKELRERAPRWMIGETQ